MQDSSVGNNNEENPAPAHVNDLLSLCRTLPPALAELSRIPSRSHLLKTIHAQQIIPNSYRRELIRVNSSAPCGLSIFSAYANRFGACLAIGERIEVSVQLGEGTEYASLHPTTLSGDKYLRACVERVCATAGRPLPAYLSIQISSGVPAGNGIKTSSALGASLTSALFEALNIKARATSIVGASSDAAREGGVTQVGSIDDIWASVRGGIVITEGSSRELIANWPAPETVEVVILIPTCVPPPIHSLDRRAVMAPHKRSFDLLLSGLLKRRDAIGMYTAMSDAAFITARAFNYPAEPLAMALRLGALGVSLSGKGPAMGAITEPNTTENVIAAWQQFPGRIIRTRPDNIGLRTIHRPEYLFSASSSGISSIISSERGARNASLDARSHS